MPGWYCKGCGWAFPTGDGRLVDRESSLEENSKAEFDKHKCEAHPRKKKTTREDVNQAAARVVRELTERR
jgi:hypothetical protein